MDQVVVPVEEHDLVMAATVMVEDQELMVVVMAAIVNGWLILT